jgi:hypothetical protein
VTSYGDLLILESCENLIRLRGPMPVAIYARQLPRPGKVGYWTEQTGRLAVNVTTDTAALGRAICRCRGHSLPDNADSRGLTTYSGIAAFADVGAFRRILLVKQCISGNGYNPTLRAKTPGI